MRINNNTVIFCLFPDTDFIRAAKMIEDEAEKERKLVSTQVVDKVMDIETYDNKENIKMQMKNIECNKKYKENGFENKDENKNGNGDIDEIEEEKLMQRNLKRVSIIVNTISSLSPSPSSTGPGMSPMTGTITPTTMMTQERYVRVSGSVCIS
jgi:hypothetical protein